MYETSKQDQANDKHLVNNNCYYQKMFTQKLKRIKYSQFFLFLIKIPELKGCIFHSHNNLLFLKN